MKPNDWLTFKTFCLQKYLWSKIILRYAPYLFSHFLKFRKQFPEVIIDLLKKSI